MHVGGSVVHPRRPETELLRPGAVLEAPMIDRLRRIGVTEVWVHHDATADLDAAVAPELSEARTAVYRRLKDDFGRMATATISAATILDYRIAISELVFRLVSSGKYAHLSYALIDEQDRSFSHAANVAFLSVLVGLEIQGYVVRERSRLSSEHARDMVPLGLGAMLHDIGKLKLEGQARHHHEIDPPAEEPETAAQYTTHAELGYDALTEIRMPATARQIVLNHHQRFDGSGWPDLATVTKGRRTGPQREGEIHVFSRIVAAANVLDNLLYDAEGNPHPTVSALREFAGPRFDGWFDPVVRDLMIRRLPPFPIGALVRLSDGGRAVVVRPNFQQPCRPAVRLLDGAGRQEAGEQPTIDLEACPDRHIVECAGQAVEEHLFDLPPLKKHGRPGPETGAVSEDAA